MTTRLLALAEWLCGAHLRRSVFEPLVADWQRQWLESRSRGPWHGVRVVAQGAGAYLTSLARCTMTSGGSLPAARTWLIATMVLVVATTAPALLLLFFTWPWGSPFDLRSMQAQAFLLFSAVIIVPPAFLPAMFLMRRAARSNPRHAIVALTLVATGTTVMVALTSEDAVRGYFSSFEASEREHARVLANDRAGRVTYPGTAVRQLRGDTTVEERRANFERFQAWRAQRSATTQPRVPTWSQRAFRLQPVALAMLFGMMGWTLAGFGTPALLRAFGWWVLMLTAMLTMTSTPQVFRRHALIPFPYWAVVPLFTLLTAALVVVSWRRRPQPTEPS